MAVAWGLTAMRESENLRIMSGPQVRSIPERCSNSTSDISESPTASNCGALAV